MTARSGGGPSIAVIVPNRNDSRFIPRCLRSVINQASPPDELIVVDDQSTDDSVAVIESQIGGVEWATLVRNPVNVGTNGALNAGLRQTKSDYVLFLSSNDFVLPGIFARARACLQPSPSAGLWSAMAWLVDEEDRPVRLQPSPVIALRDAVFSPKRCIALAHRHGNWFTGTTLTYRRQALDEVGGFDPAYGGLADLITALVIASRHGVAYSPEPFSAIRVHARSFLSATLSDPTGVEAMLAQLAVRGPELSPALFTTVFTARTAARFRFASVRTSGGRALAEVGLATGGLRGAFLKRVGALLPARLRLARVALAFLVLRPFDIVPTLLERMLGWALVRIRGGRMPDGEA